MTGSNCLQCDELGPPCAACVARDTATTCVYVNSRSITPNDSTPSSSSTDVESSLGPVAIEPDESTARRLLELKLMHRWMTHTWKCLHGMDEDVEFLLEQMPQACLKYDYVLHSTLALCATDLAIHGEQKPLQTYDTMVYVETALSYYDLASQTLRTQLGKVDPESLTWVYMASVSLTMIQMALPQCLQLQSDEPQPSMIERMGVIIELFMGNGKVALLDFLSLFDGPGAVMVQKASRLVNGPPPIDVDPALKAASENMRSVVNSVSTPDSEISTPAYHTAYARVTKLLELSLNEESRGELKGMCVAVPMYCGRDFYTAVNEAQPTALFLLMVFGALMERGTRDGFWWANGIGLGLVQEASEILAKTQPQLIQMSEWRDGIAWARAEVGLPILL
jgi:hypothetical protein